jgi:N-acetylneuraminate synthase
LHHCLRLPDRIENVGTLLVTRINEGPPARAAALMSIFITAEIGINHNGSIEIAKHLIDAAKEAGADAVKFQKRTVDLVYTKDVLDSPRDSPWGTTQRDQKEGLEFGADQFREIDRHCRAKGIAWFASAWDLESQQFLRAFELKYNKIASAMLVFESLLKMVAGERKHTFISTGMCRQADIDHAVAIFKAADCPFELMHCVSTYPMNDEDANLNRIRTLRDRYRCDVGYSGHEVGLAVSYAAAALGITSLERHITLDRAMYGSDQAASVEPAGFRMLVGAVRKIERAMGNGALEMNPKEASMARKLRAHIPLESQGPV